MPARKSPFILPAIAFLHRYPAGRYSADIARCLGQHPVNAKRMLTKLLRADTVRAILEGVQSAPRRMRFYLPAHEEVALAAHEFERGKTWGFGRHPQHAMPKCHAPKPRSTTGHPWKTKPPIPTECPMVPGPTLRDAGYEPETLFVDLGIGHYLHTGSAIEAACGVEA